jgi:hypothetical protein
MAYSTLQKRLRMTRRPFPLKLAAVMLGGLTLFSPPQIAAAAPLDARVIESGHSLTDPIPELLERMIVAAGGQRIAVARSTIPGSPMEWRWTHKIGYGNPDARHDIAQYDVLVITERVSLATTMPYHNTLDEATKWTRHAWKKGNGGNGAETILYATWVGLTTGPGTPASKDDPDNQLAWPDRLTKEYGDWRKIQSHMNKTLPRGAPKVRMIPGPLLMKAIYDDIQRGKVPGVNRIQDFFADDIHTSDLGSYAVALLHFAVIYERDPRDLGRIQGAPRNAKLDAYLRALVWRIVTSASETGVAG